MPVSSSDKPPGALWLQQAASDFNCAEYLRRMPDAEQSKFYCHIIAKYQQSVEKTLKGMIAALSDAEVSISEPSYFSHTLEAHLNVLTRLPNRRQNETIQSHINAVLDSATRTDINALSHLAPKKPAPGQPAPRNTEYPFQRSGAWIAPTQSGVFEEADVERFQKTARHTLMGLRKVVDALPVARKVKKRGA